MAELYDKEGNPIDDIYNEAGDPIDETLTSEEVDTKIQEAKEEVTEEVNVIKTELEEKTIALKAAEEQLDKENVKGKNFENLRKTTKQKEEEAETLQTEVTALKERLGVIESTAKSQPVNTIIDKLAGDDDELKGKIKFHYDSFAIPDEDTEEKRNERIKNAHFLATGGNATDALGSDAIGSGGGGKSVQPGGGKGESKLSSGGIEVGKNLGITDKEMKKHKLT